MIFPVTIFLATIAYLPSTVSVTVVGRWAVLAIGASLCLFSIQKLVLDRAQVWAGLFVVWAMASVFWSASPLDTIGESWHWLVLFILFLVATQWQKPVVVLWALCLGLIVNVPFVLLQLEGVNPVLTTDVPGGLFLSRNALGEISACALVWAIARRQWVLVPATLLLVLTSGSRGALLACIVAVVFWASRRYNWRQRILFALVSLLGVVGLVLLRPESSLIRLDIWWLTLTNLTFFGRGLETFGVLAPQYEFVHNDLLQLFFEFGIGTFFAAPIFIRAIRRRSPEAVALVALAGASAVSFPLHHPMGAALMAVLTGLSIGSRARAERSERISRAVVVGRVGYERNFASTNLRRA